MLGSAMSKTTKLNCFKTSFTNSSWTKNQRQLSSMKNVKSGLFSLSSSGNSSPLKPFTAFPSFAFRSFGSVAPSDPSAKKRILKFSLKEVNEHHTPGDIWIVIDKKVYNISEWVLKHPGGLVITGNAGADSTYAFHNKHTHSEAAREIMQQYYIGELADEIPHRPDLAENQSILEGIKVPKVEWPSRDH